MGSSDDWGGEVFALRLRQLFPAAAFVRAPPDARDLSLLPPASRPAVATAVR